MSMNRELLVSTGIKIGSFFLQNIVFTSWVTDERTDERTGIKHCASGPSMADA